VPLNYAIIDEVDNILVDEARTPLIISGQAFTDVRRYDRANLNRRAAHRPQKTAPASITRSRKKEHTCHLTDEGIRKAEELAGVESFYTAATMEWPHLIDMPSRPTTLQRRQALRPSRGTRTATWPSSSSTSSRAG